jgi:hypothetical protein
MELLKSAPPEQVRETLRAGADPRVVDENGTTALMQAAYYNRDADVSRALLEAGANANAEDFNGETPLYPRYTIILREAVAATAAYEQLRRRHAPKR